MRAADHAPICHAAHLFRAFSCRRTARRFLFHRPGRADAVWRGSCSLDRRTYPAAAPFHPALALLAAACFGALWGLVPAMLREFIGVNEIISTLLLNSVAGVLVSLVRLGRLSITARLLPLVASTKVTSGILLAVAAAYRDLYLPLENRPRPGNTQLSPGAALCLIRWYSQAYDRAARHGTERRSCRAGRGS